MRHFLFSSSNPCLVISQPPKFTLDRSPLVSPIQMNESPFLRLFLAVPFFQKSSHKSLADCVRPNSRFKTPEDVPTLKMHSLKVRDVFHQYATHGLHTPFLYPRITGGFNLRQHAIHNIHTMVACYITVYGTRQLIG